LIFLDIIIRLFPQKTDGHRRQNACFFTPQNSSFYW
jgi:hypothetical protein